MTHLFSMFGDNYVLDTESGAVHIADELTMRILKETDRVISDSRVAELTAVLCDDYDRIEVMEACGEINALAADGLLFSDAEASPALAIHTENVPVKALCLHVSHDCNLRCKYCFASTGDFGLGRKTMDASTAKKAIDFVLMRSGKRHNIEIDFFGGEPLMAFDTVREALEYARSREEECGKRFNFTITTNGLLLDEQKAAYINEHMDNAVLSLDGRREVNDNMRSAPNGKGSYDLIVDKFKCLADEREALGRDYNIRGTYTALNRDFSEDIFHMADLGFKNISVEPVVAHPEEYYALKEDDLTELKNEYERLARSLLERERSGNGINFFHFNIDLEQGPCIIKRIRGCGAGSEYVAVTPEGDIYPCHQFVGMEDYRMGNVNDASFDEDMARRFAGVNVYSRKQCRDCWAKYYCSGGCSAANLNANGDINLPYSLGCELEKKRIECAIAMIAARKDIVG